MFPSAIQRVLLFMLLVIAALVSSLHGVNQRQIVLNSQQATFVDIEGTPLDLGELKLNQDGDLIQLGYFAEASTSNLFQGDWVPLTEALHFGDSSTLSGGNPGQFQVSILFLDGTDEVTVYPDAAGVYLTNSSHVITSSSPKGSPGQLLAIRYFDKTGISEGVRYNTVAGPTWKWEPLSDQLGFPTIIAIDTQSSGLAFQDSDNPYIASIKKNISSENLPIYTVSGNITEGNGTIQGFGKYEEGTSASLVATPDLGYNFVAWSGDVASSDASIVTDVNSNMVIDAEFEIQTFDFNASISPENSGTVQGIGTYDYNESVELTAIPETGFRFLYWEIDDEQVTEEIHTLQSTQDYEIIAVFEPLFYSLTFLNSPEEGGTVNGGGTFSYGTIQSISAVPSEGYQFEEWQGGTVADPNTANTTFTITQDTTLKAIFSLIPEPTNTVTLIATPEEGGNLTGGGVHDHGSLVSIQAIPAEEYYFEQWLDEQGETYFSNPLELLVNQNLQRTAVFDKKPFKVQVSGDFDKEFFAPEGSGTYFIGDEITLSATPLDNWELSHWSTDGEMEFGVKALPHPDESGLTLYIDDLLQRELRFVRGGTYNFMVSDVTMSEQPFYISENSQGDDSGNFEGEYSDNVTNSRATTGLITFTPDDNTPDTLFYHSGGSAGSGGMIKVYDPEYLLSSPESNPTVLSNIADAALVANYKLQSYELIGTAFPSYGGSIQGTGDFEWGSQATITAIPNENYSFIGWDGVPSEEENSNPVTLTISEETSVTANFSYTGPATHNLTIEVNPQASGSVSGGGTINHATEASISATPAAGYRFVSWTGYNVEDSESASTDTDVILEDTTIIANFELIPVYTLTINSNPANAGLLFGTGDYQTGSNVTIIALPFSEYEFAGWAGSDGLSDPDSSTTQINITEDTSLTANFNFIGTDTYDLSLNASPSNGGTLEGSGTYDKGKQVSIEAVPNPGWEFVSWTEGDVSDANSAQTSLQLLSDTTITANFTFVGLPIYTLTIQQNPTEGGSVTGAGEYEESTVVDITATPATGYEFIGWTGGVPETPSEPDTTITLLSDTTLIANYQFLGVGNTLTISSSPEEGGTSTGAGNYAADSHVSIQAVPSPGYKFTGWTGGNVDSPESIQTQLTLSSNTNLIANFETLEEYTVTVIANPSNGATVTGEGDFLEGTTVSLLVTPATGYTFLGWSGIEFEDSLELNPEFTLESDSRIFANLQYTGPSTHDLNLSSNLQEGVILKGSGTYGHGASALIEAVVQKGYKFSHWSDGKGNNLSENPTRIDMISTKSLTAQLEEIQITASDPENDLTWQETWIGLFMKSNQDWIFSLNHGWLYPEGESDDSVWLATQEGQWYWTSKEVYPWLYKEEDATWYYYSLNASSPTKAYYYNSSAEKWIHYSPPEFP